MKRHFWEAFSKLVLLPARNSQRRIRLRSAGEPTRRLMTYLAPLTLIACAGPGYIEIPTYQHYYFYEPRVAVVPASAIKVAQDGRTVDLAFEGSKNILSITTIPSRGDQGFIMGSRGTATGYTGVLGLDAVTRNDGSIPMRLWVTASCRGEDWVILPSKVRLVDRTRDSSEIPLTDYLQPIPAVLHPDSQVFTGHWQYAKLDPNREIRCAKGGTVAFTVGFETALAFSSLRIVFADSLQGDGEVLHIPDVELSLTGGKHLESTKRASILEILFRAAAGFSGY